MFKTKFLVVPIVCLALLFGLHGCSQLNPDPGNPPQVNWDQVAASLESVTVLITSYALNNPELAPYRDQICDVAGKAGEVLATYDDKDLSLALVKQIIHEQAEKIADPTIREVVVAAVDLVVDHVFGYAWDRYADLIDKDEVRLAALLGDSIVSGVGRVCAATEGMGVSSVDVAPSRACGLKHSTGRVYGVNTP